MKFETGRFGVRIKIAHFCSLTTCLSKACVFVRNLSYF